MLKKIIIAVCIILVAIGIGIGVANACPVIPRAPRAYCFNEPTRHHGQAVNHITCVSPGYPGRG